MMIKEMTTLVFLSTFCSTLCCALVTWWGSQQHWGWWRNPSSSPSWPAGRPCCEGTWWVGWHHPRWWPCARVSPSHWDTGQPRTAPACAGSWSAETKEIHRKWINIQSVCLHLNSCYCSISSLWAHLINMYVVVVWGVVDGFEEALKLARGSSVDHQDKCYSHWLYWKTLSGVLIPLDIHVGFTCAGIQTKASIFTYIIK